MELDQADRQFIDTLVPPKAVVVQFLTVVELAKDRLLNPDVEDED